MEMNDEIRDELAKQVMELNGALKDAAIRLRTGLDIQSTALHALTEQVKELNLKIERLCKKT